MIRPASAGFFMPEDALIFVETVMTKMLRGIFVIFVNTCRGGPLGLRGVKTR